MTFYSPPQQQPPPPPPTLEQLLAEGKRQHQMGNLPAAQHLYQQVLARQPDHLDALNLLGMVAMMSNQPEVASDLLGKVLALAPQEMLVRLKLAQALQKAGRGEDALRIADSILRDGGDSTKAMGHYARSIVLHAQGRDEEAIVDAEQAEAINPTGQEELLILPTIYLALGKFQEARQASQRAIAVHPTRGEHYWNLALTSLLLGDMEAGWPAFQWRLRTPMLRHLAPPQGKPLWEGQDLSGKTILVYREGGFGDALQFVRYVPLLEKRSRKVILSAPPELYDLFKCVPVTQLLLQVGPIPECDFVCPLQSLPLHFKTTVETIPAEVPYLKADPQKSRAWGSRMPAGEGLKVGLAWSGSLGSIERRTRSLSMFAPLANIPGVRFFSLQKGAESWQSVIAPAGMELINLMPEARDFADLAGIIDNLDLVISVDTSVPHLAGAMGKPVWTLIPFIPDFRWMIEREDSPWYPTMKLFRQKTPRGWDEVLSRIATELRALAESKK